ncbi:MAG TPA: sigma 54-interacting transcriptional regulator [Kofleriaceae bacterium]|nr:sigma 54-interacting transcriptional regulator [Kofleriaceae bacterium]
MVKPPPGATLHTVQVVRDDALVALRRHRLRLEVLRGADRKLRKDFDLDRIVIGSHERCDLCLNEPTVSRQHCEIALTGDGYAIRDLASTNGTFVGDVRIKEVVVDRETKLRVGDALLRLVPSGDTVELPLSVHTSFGPLLGKSPAMRRLFESLRKIAPTDATVLITGESGTGKEVAARAIHEASARARGPFVVVDCGALPGNLIESELFGHVRGSFTGAVKDRVGAFESASGGTVFLDEIGELPIELQTRLLGVLERRSVTPLGGTEPRSIDVRVLAATHRDLRRQINRGAFREDLFFRLAVVTVEMPALRHRREDIRLYVEKFLDELGARGALTLDEPTLARLEAQSWPGNVRELRNLVERAAALGDEALPDAADAAPADAAPAATLPAIAGELDVAVPFKIAKQALVDDFERAYCERLLAAHDNNITRAARAAELDRVYLLRVLDKYGLRPKR